ncbi:unnamed protein product [Ectocarpus fasciculatus]
MASETETLKKDIDELRGSIEKLSKDVSSMGQSMAQDLKAKAGNAAESIRDGAKATAQQIGEKGKQGAEAVENTVRERPFQSLLVAFGAGLLLAQLLRRR